MAAPIYLKKDGRYIGIDPAKPDEVYANRIQPGPWEEVEFLPQPLGSTAVRLRAANRLLCDGPEHLESRPVGAVGPYEQFHLSTALLGYHHTLLEVSGAGLSARPISRLHLDGTQLRDADGKDVFLMMATAFLLYEAWLDDRPRYDRIVNELLGWGANAVRVFGMAHYIPINEYGRRAFAPQHYGDRYYTEAPKFLANLRMGGFYAYWSIFPDAGLIMPNAADQQRHYARLVPILEDAETVLIELTNEPDAHDFNRVDPTLFARPTRALACSGGLGANYTSVPPHTWDFGDLHVNRNDRVKSVLDCCPADNPIYKAGKGLLMGEPCRYGSNGDPGDVPPSHAQQAASAARAGAMGWCFHSRNGVRLEPFDAETRPFAEAVFRGAYGAL